ncbi:hypothetical protein M0812_26958 [Anaeramoeba flamelloides]|uniref:Uncharacterized protein n=1 Tax=Anaeramoeba flamelloides TaxID=1746091 RepID=A0AAV7YH60_9EUKA|nr:hypothetical protein M0812_26958 [Anaeramoeba flamelloides]
MKNRFFNSSKKKLNTFQNDQCLKHTQHKPNKQPNKINSKPKLPNSCKKNQQPQLERPKAPHNRTQDLMDQTNNINNWVFQKEIGINQNRIVVDNYGFVINENGSNQNLKW